MKVKAVIISSYIDLKKISGQGNPRLFHSLNSHTSTCLFKSHQRRTNITQFAYIREKHTQMTIETEVLHNNVTPYKCSQHIIQQY